MATSASGRCATPSCAPRARCCSPAGSCRCWSATTSWPTRCRGLLLEQFALPPTDRLAAAFLAYDAADAGARTFGAYDRFLGLLDDPGARAELERLGREEVHASAVFQTARRLGREVQQGLLALLFEREPLRRLIRQYGVF